MFYVYVLKSKKDGKLYTGYTNNLKSRIERHNNGHEKATKERRPLELVYYEASYSRKDAMKREKYLKTAWGKAYIRKRLFDYFKKNRKSR